MWKTAPRQAPSPYPLLMAAVACPKPVERRLKLPLGLPAPLCEHRARLGGTRRPSPAEPRSAQLPQDAGLPLPVDLQRHLGPINADNGCAAHPVSHVHRLAVHDRSRPGDRVNNTV